MGNPENTLSRGEFIRLTTAGVGGLFIKDIQLPHPPYIKQQKEIQIKYGVELPVVTHPILVRIIDDAHPINATFLENDVKPNLVKFTDETKGSYNFVRSAPVINKNIQIHKLCVSDLANMIDDCWSTWGRMYVQSGYRDAWTRRFVYVKNKGNTRYIANPDATQHSNGLTIDSTSTEIGKIVNSNAGFENTNVYKWMIDNAGKYGFVQSYIDNKNHDGKIDEPWHWTYVGPELSEAYHQLRDRGWNGDVFELQDFYPQP